MRSSSSFPPRKPLLPRSIERPSSHRSPWTTFMLLFALLLLGLLSLKLFAPAFLPSSLRSDGYGLPVTDCVQTHHTPLVEKESMPVLVLDDPQLGLNGNVNVGTDVGTHMGLDANANVGTYTGTAIPKARRKALAVIGIQTGYDNASIRKSIRETWLPSEPDDTLSLEQAAGLVFRFVIGRTNNTNKTEELNAEASLHGDIIRLDIEEGQFQPAHKTLAFLKAAYDEYEADFYVKMNDDIYLRPDRLAALLAKDRAFPRTYIGCMKKGPVVTDQKVKWYEPLAYLIGSEYFYHANGPIYALSAEVVASLAAASNDSFRYFANEDVTIGVWMLARNVNHEDNKGFCSPKCTTTAIAVWDIPKCSGLCNAAEKMRELHKKDECSKSPTLPTDHS